MKKAKGFTLVELIIVVAILAIVCGVASQSWTAYKNQQTGGTTTGVQSFQPQTLACTSPDKTIESAPGQLWVFEGGTYVARSDYNQGETYTPVPGQSCKVQ